MEIILLLLFVIVIDALNFFNREKREEEIYRRTVNDVNFGRFKSRK